MAKPVLCERLEEVRENRGYSLKGFWQVLKECGGLSLSYESARWYHFNRVPPLAYLESVSEAFGYRLEWLARGTGPQTVDEEERTKKAQLSLLSDLLGKDEYAEFIEKLPASVPGGPPSAPGGPLPPHMAERRRRAAIRRFGRRLRDAEFSGAPWYREYPRERLLAAAMRFLVSVDGFFETMPAGDEASLVRDTERDYWYAQWSDAVLSLFGMRVVGLGTLLVLDRGLEQWLAPSEGTESTGDEEAVALEPTVTSATLPMDVGDSREALIPPGENLATTDPDIA